MQKIVNFASVQKSGITTSIVSNMKKFIGVALAAACACPSQAAGEQTKLDTTRVNNLNEVVVKAVRAPKSSHLQ